MSNAEASGSHTPLLAMTTACKAVLLIDDPMKYWHGVHLVQMSNAEVGAIPLVQPTEQLDRFTLGV